MTPPPEVIVVGAGPAGSATAIHLARAGRSVALLDRAAFPRDKPCSEFLSPEAVRLLTRLGVVPGLEAAGAQPLLGTRVFGPRGASLTGTFARAGIRPFRDAGLSVARTVLDAALVAAAAGAGARVIERAMVEALLYDGGAVAGVVFREADGTRRSLRARLLVGADGLRSTVARRIGRRRHGRPARLAFVAHVADVPGLDGHAEMHVGEPGYVGLNRIAGPGPGRENLANVALVLPRRSAGPARGRVAEFFFTELGRFPGVRGRVRADRVIRPVQVTGPFAARSDRVVADGALLVGDAADFFDPFTGEGIYSALRGAELAAETALGALSLPGPVTARRLAPYVAGRRAAFLGKWAVERLVGYGMSAPRLFDRVVARLERRGLAHTFVGVTGDWIPARTILHPAFLLRMVL